jgi:hypothetical protein
MEVVHRRDLFARFGIKASPPTLARWKKLGFPAALSVPAGCFVVPEVQAWLERRAKEPRATRPSHAGRPGAGRPCKSK